MRFTDHRPLGQRRFVEDYEYVADSGDLDEFNGRSTVTPEYQGGTYAYFLSTDSAGRLAFPYLIGRAYYGRIAPVDLNHAVQMNPSPYGRDGREAAGGGRGSPETLILTRRLRASLSWSERPFTVEAEETEKGKSLGFCFRIFRTGGSAIHHLEYVHERPMHLVIVSEDLEEFQHIHPMLTAGDRYEVTTQFRHGGHYRMYLEFTPPGAGQQSTAFDLIVNGRRPTPMKLPAETATTRTADGIQIRLAGNISPKAVVDADLNFEAIDSETGNTIRDLEPYLGAWAHILAVDQNRTALLHTHPLADGLDSAVSTSSFHSHAVPAGPSPEVIRFTANSPKSGLYKLWIQFQRNGKVVAVPFVFRVVSAGIERQPLSIPAGAIRIRITSGGYQPDRITTQKGKPVTLAVYRAPGTGCASRIVFPSIGVTRDLPAGKTTLIDLPPLPPGEFHFACGMGMYRGALLVLE